MTAPHHDRMRRLTLLQLNLIDERCDRFEGEWKHAAEPRINDYLDGVDEAVRGVLWLELAVTDQELRERAGEQTSLERYLPSCPDPRVLLELSTDLGSLEREYTRGVSAADARFAPLSTPVPQRPDALVVSGPTGPVIMGEPLLGSTVEADAADTTPLGLKSTQPDPADRPRGSSQTMNPGLRLGDYELLEVIARGGMGVVYKARQVRLNRMVALKTMRAGFNANEREIRFFRREAEAVAALDHPHIVPIFEVGEWEGLLFHSMKLVIGRTLQEALAEYRDQPRDVARLVSIIARAIHHAHQRGVLHRDLKPSNILIDQAGIPYVIDFGLARRVGVDGESRISNSVVGTLNYMSPEQANGRHEEITTATDIYGLGAILYALLSGRAPYSASSIVDLVRQMLDAEPVRPRARVREVEPDLEVICLKCLVKEPERRYATVNALADDLDRWLDGVPIVARPATGTERIVKFIRRRRALSAMVGLLGITVAIGAGGVVWQWREAVAARGGLQIALVAAQKSEKEALNSEDQALQMAYAARINLAERDWRDANVTGVERHLAETRPLPGKNDLRGFEWRYLNRLAHTANRTLTGHEGEVWVTAYSKDGKLLASASQDKTVRIWDPANGRLIRTLTTTNPNGAVAFDREGGRLASAGADRAVTLWDVATGQVIRRFEGHSAAIHGIAVSPDSRTLASSSADGDIRIWDLETGRTLHIIKDHPLKYLAAISFSPDGKSLAASGVETANPRLWDVGSGKLVRILKDDQGTPCFLPVFAPDGKTIATSSVNGSIKLWDSSNGALLRTIYDAHNREMIRGLEYSPDGKNLACTRQSGQALELWDVASGSLVRIFRGHRRSLLSVAYSPDGRHISTSSNDATIRIWNRDQDQELRSLVEPDTVLDLVFAPDSALLVSANRDQSVRLWDHAGQRLVRVLEGHTGKARSVVVSPNGRMIASAADDQTVRLWEISTGKQLFILRGHTAAVEALAFRRDGQVLASGSDDHSIRLWNPSTGETIKALEGHPGSVRFLAFTGGDQSLVSGGGDGFVMTWDVESGRRQQAFLAEADSLVGIDLSPDGRLLATSSEDRIIRIRDLKTQQVLHRLGGHGLIPYRLRFSPDGKRLASVSSDRTVRIWDPILGRELLVLRGHDQAVWSLAFSPDGHRLATGGSDHNIKIWDASDEPEDVPPQPPR